MSLNICTQKRVIILKLYNLHLSTPEVIPKHVHCKVYADMLCIEEVRSLQWKTEYIQNGFTIYSKKIVYEMKKF